MEEMKLFLIFFIAVFISFWPLTWGQKQSMYLYDRMGLGDKSRMVNVSERTIIDAQIRIRQISGIRADHSDQLAFDVGVVMGNMREKYRRMVETYREYRDKHNKRSIFFPASFMLKFIPGYYIVAMQLVHIQEVEIDKLVHVLETIDNDDLNPDPRYDPVKKRKKHKLRAGEEAIIRRMAEEQELKSSYREQHLLRRLHMKPAQHTTAKRFQRQWPVDANWDLGPYGDMGLYGGH